MQHVYQPTDCYSSLFYAATGKSATLIVIKLDEFLLMAPHKRKIDRFYNTRTANCKFKLLLHRPTEFLGWLCSHDKDFIIHLAQQSLEILTLAHSSIKNTNPTLTSYHNDVNISPTHNGVISISNHHYQYCQLFYYFCYQSFSTRPYLS